MTAVPPLCSSQAVFVEASARLHFGVLDLRGALGRWFGGIGAAAPAPSLLVSASEAEALEIKGEDACRAGDFARRFLACYAIRRGARVHVHRTLPSHTGLGSGTQLALAVARALAELYAVQADAAELARAVGRARRSAIGTWTFAGGGLVVEGGRRPQRDGVAPLLARLAFPPSWQCVLAVPTSTPSMSGTFEAEAIAHLPSPPEREVERVAHLVLMALLPGLADADLSAFGAALTEIQAITGRWFAPAQGGPFASGLTEELIRRMAAWGARGMGQSSWGPTVYGIVDGEGAGIRLAERLSATLGAAGTVYYGPFPTNGARVWHGQLPAVEG